MKPVCLVLCLAATAASAGPLRIQGSPGAPALERHAAAELRSYLPRLTAEPLGRGEGEGTQIVLGTVAASPALQRFLPALPGDLAAQEILVRSGTLDGKPAVAVTGGSPATVLWAAYALLEQLGVVFEFSGEIIPRRVAELDLTRLDLRRQPSIAERGMRLHLNFPMDQSAYSLPDFLAWVDRVARMKCNYLMFHFYSGHPWFYFKFRGAETRSATFFAASYMFGGKYMLPGDMIGRSLIANRAQFFPPELEGMEPGVDLYRRTQERLGAVMDRCHRRGIKVAVSFEPLSPPGDIAAHLGEWEKDFGSHDALMRELTVARLNACMDAYPQADEYQLISVEGSDDAPQGLDLRADLKRLCAKYRIPFDPDNEAGFSGEREKGVNLTPYNAPAVAAELERGLYRPVVSTLRYVDLALEVLKDPRISGRMAREGKQENVGIYLPNPPAVKLCTPALRVMMPPHSRLALMCDYGARGTADQMPTWDAFRGADLQLGVMSWLEFDGSMLLPESWPHSVFDCVRNAAGLPLTTLVCNHWRVSGLEADAAAVAEVPWQRGTYDDWLDGYLARTFGVTAAPLARRAYDALEAATLYCRAHLFNVGFCYEGRWRGGYDYPPELLEGAKKLFEQARIGFLVLDAALPEGRPRLRAMYLADRCKCAQAHLDCVQELRGAEVSPEAPPEQLKAASEHAQRALEHAREYMNTYSQLVLDRGDQGMMVAYHFGVVEEAEMLARAARQLSVIAAADPQRPLMHWSFEQGGARAIPDATGNGFEATCVGRVEFAPGKVGRALKLDGKSYLRVDGAGAFNPRCFTLSAWVLPERSTARRGIVVKRIGNVAAPWVFSLAEGNLSFEGCDTTPTFWPFNFVGPAVPAGRWSHVAVTLEAGRAITLYLGGKAVATKAITGAPAPNGEPLVIGREAWGGEEGHEQPAYFRGLLDEVKVWKRALSPEEVAAEAGG